MAQADMKEKGKRYGKGGAFSAVGLVGFLTLQALAVTAIAALAVPLPVWAAALIVRNPRRDHRRAGVDGHEGGHQAASPAPEQTIETIDSVKADLAEIKESAQR
ncbi:phage holin family protein [Streptomyces coeruleorubidus]